MNQKMPLSKFRHLSETLFDQQMWCWGQDICRAEGNLLVEYGFTRHAPPDTLPKRVSRYQWTVSPHTQLILWGFGLFYGCPLHGGLFLKRFEFTPRLLKNNAASKLAIWQVEDLPMIRKPNNEDDITLMGHLLADSLHWISHYEQWVLAQAGLAYRQACLSRWHKKVAVTADNMAVTWQQLAGHWRDPLVAL